jgi:hypothetical protein
MFGSPEKLVEGVEEEDLHPGRIQHLDLVLHHSALQLWQLGLKNKEIKLISLIPGYSQVL